jgi:hypothetical protein
VRWFVFAWVIAGNCIGLLAVLLVFAKIASSPQAIVIAVLGLMYVAAEVRGRYQNMAFARAMVELNGHLLRIRGLLRDAQFEEQAAHLLNVETTLRKQYEPGVNINLFFLGLISLVCAAVVALELIRN